MGRACLAMGILLGSARLLAPQCPDGSVPPCAADATPSKYSVAVLTFITRGVDSTSVHIGEQLADEVTSALARVERLTVKSRRLIQLQERSRPTEPAAIGRALQVRFLVDGSLQGAGTRLRARIQLIRASDGVVQWNQSFSSSLDSLFELQEGIAREVATAIAGRLLPAESQRMMTRAPASGVAYAHFLRGNSYLARRTERSLSMAADAYASAVRHDPLFSRALARIAYAHALLAWYDWSYGDKSGAELVRVGFASAERAIRSDSNDADAWLARGTLLLVAYNDSARLSRNRRPDIAAFRRAVELDSRNAEAWHRYGHALASYDKDESLAAYLRALSLDPLRAVTMSDMGWVHLQLRQHRQALFWLDSAIATDSAYAGPHLHRALTLLEQRDAAGARAALSRALLLDPATPKRGRDYLRAMLQLSVLVGDTLTARKHYSALIERDTSAVNRAIAMAILNDDRALGELERISHPGLLYNTMQLYWFDLFKGHARFETLAQRAERP